MKHLIFGGAVGVLVLLLFVAVLSVETRSVREEEMQQALSDAVDEAVEELHVSDMDAFTSDEQLVSFFEEQLLLRLQSNGNEKGQGDPNLTLSVKVAEADVKKGILFVRVKETFTYPNGKTGEVSDQAQIVIEQEAMRDMRTVRYEMADGTTKIYQTEEDCALPVPEGDIISITED